jgi:hypothetical protein
MGDKPLVERRIKTDIEGALERLLRLSALLSTHIEVIIYPVSEIFLKLFNGCPFKPDQSSNAKNTTMKDFIVRIQSNASRISFVLKNIFHIFTPIITRKSLTSSTEYLGKTRSGCGLWI